MFILIVPWCRTLISQGLKWLEDQLLQQTKPCAVVTLVDAVGDLARSKEELVIENSFLRQQIVVLNRTVKRPTFTNNYRRLLVMLASRLKTWREALLLVKPDTVLSWHRLLFKAFWRRKSRAKTGRPALED